MYLNSFSEQLRAAQSCSSSANVQSLSPENPWQKNRWFWRLHLLFPKMFVSLTITNPNARYAFAITTFEFIPWTLSKHAVQFIFIVRTILSNKSISLTKALKYVIFICVLLEFHRIFLHCQCKKRIDWLPHGIWIVCQSKWNDHNLFLHPNHHQSHIGSFHRRFARGWYNYRFCIEIVPVHI